MDLNADLGESFGRWRLGDDRGLLALVTSGNVACGFHAGDPTTLLTTCRQAVTAGVTIGAQVGYRDLAGFGRRFIDVDPEDLYADVLYQIGALDGLARTSGGAVRYVKPHGALYNTVVHHRRQARAVVAAVADYPGELPLLGLPGSVLHEFARERDIRCVAEAFADRGYRSDGTLVPRSEPGAVLHEPEVVAARAVRMVTERVVTATDGAEVEIDADSICLHGDSPGAVDMATAVRAALLAAGVGLEPFAR